MSTPPADNNETAKKKAARNAAIAALIAAHPEQFADLMTAQHQARGVEWKRRLTPEQRAEREAQERAAKAERAAKREAERAQRALDDLVARHPILQERLAPSE